MSVQEYLEIFLRRKWYFFLPFVGIILLSGILAYILPDVYRSTTVILVESQKVPENFVRPTVTTKIEGRLNTITQQIMSRTRLEKIIQEFGLYQGVGQRSGPEAILVNIPWVNSYLGLTALGTDTAVDRMRKDIQVNVNGRGDNRDTDLAFTVSYHGSNPEVTMHVTEKVASLFIEENLKIREKQAEGTSEFLESELNNSRLHLEQQEKQIKEFKQRYMGELPQQLDANLRALDRFQMEMKATLEALKAAEDRKESIEKLLSTALPESGMGGSTLLTRLDQLKTQLSNLRAEYKEDYPDIALTQKEIKEIEEALAQGDKNLESKSGSSTRESRDTLSQNQSRDPLTRNLATQLRDANIEISVLKTRRANLMKQISLYEKRVEDTPLREQQLMTIQRDYENIQKNYQSLLDKRLEAKISENLEKRQQGEIFRILDPANLPLSPYTPNRAMIVLVGLVFALGGGLGLVFLREQLDQSFKTGEELSEAVGMPVLAMIPHQPLLKRVQPLKTHPAVRGNHKISQRSGLLVQKAPPALLQYMVGIQDPSSVTVEQFRILHTWLEQAHKARGWKVFCVTSAVKGEGKTFTAVNLAMTMARDFGKKVLLMDMDCKGTMLQKLVDRDDQVHPGWANVVQKKGSLHEALISFNSDKLFMLPIGRVNVPSSGLIALLESSHLLEELRAEFDYILMDAPPVLPLADMRLLENMVDGIILVVRSDETTRDLEIKASSSVLHDKILGYVLNGVKRDFSHYYYYESSDMLSGENEKV